MTLDDALAELGIDADASPDAARRAYLKLLKKRKPEVDPDGFMRLREAYELVKERADFMASWRVVVTPPSDEAEAPAAPPAESEAAPRADHAPEPERDAPKDEPDAPAPEREDAEETAAPERDAEPEEEPSPPLGLDVVEQMIEAGQQAAAASMLAVIYEDAAHDIRAHVPPIHRTLSLVLSLYAEGDHEGAKKLYESAAAWLRANGLEARVLRGELAARWMVARELSALPSSFSKVVRKAIARAAEGGELADARDALVRYQAKRPARAYEAATMLKTRAPTLASVFAATLESPPAHEATPATRSKGMSGWAMAAIAVAVMRLLMFIGRSSTTTPSFDPARFSRPLPAIAVDAGGDLSAAIDALKQHTQKLQREQAPLAKASAERVRDHTRRQKAGKTGKRAQELDAIVREATDLIDAVDREDCVSARAHARDLRAAFASDAGASADRDDAERARRAVELMCGHGSPRDAGNP